MRTLSVIKEALLVLVSSAAAALLLFVCFQEITRPAGMKDATLGRLLPIATNKSPWWLLIAVVLLAVWFGAHAMGKPRGVLWGLWRWGVRIGFWWSGVALLLFAGVAIHGAHTRSVADLNWRFALGYLVVSVSILIACGIGRVRAR
ncbi:MAG TPA: hypothetical protein VN757_07100 [Steroidobacteraceae bacterium]|nr:hypothetical protein [Steroidobacteraceae bacterium]